MFKVKIFLKGHKISRNLHGRFDRYYIGQIYGGDFAKNCGLLRICKLYHCAPILDKVHNGKDKHLFRAEILQIIQLLFWKPDDFTNSF